MTVWTDTLPDIGSGGELLGEDIEILVQALHGVADAWTAFTPTWSASGTAVSLGNAAISGSYRQVGKWVEYRGLLTMGSTTTYGTGFYRFTLPVTAVAIELVGVAQLLDFGTQDKCGSCYTFSTALLVPVSSAGAVGPTVPHTWATSDQIRWHISYEAA